MLTVALKTKYLDINLTKPVLYVYAEHCKTLMKETKGDLNKWRAMQCACIRRQQGRHVNSQIR